MFSCSVIQLFEGFVVEGLAGFDAETAGGFEIGFPFFAHMSAGIFFKPLCQVFVVGVLDVVKCGRGLFFCIKFLDEGVGVVGSFVSYPIAQATVLDEVALVLHAVAESVEALLLPAELRDFDGGLRLFVEVAKTVM